MWINGTGAVWISVGFMCSWAGMRNLFLSLLVNVVDYIAILKGSRLDGINHAEF